MSNYVSRTFNVFPYFASGYTVSAYPVSNWPGDNVPSGTPRGSSVSTGTVASDGSLVLRIAAGTQYYLASNGSGSYVYIKVHGGDPVASTGVAGGVLVASCGDSITAQQYAGATMGYEVLPYHGYLSWAQMLSGGRIKFAGAFGTGGYTAQQIRSTKVPLVLAADPKPQFCIVLAGANNEDDTDLSACLAAIEGCWTDLRAGGVEPIALSLTPRTSASATQRKNIAEINAFISHRAPVLGVMFVDCHTVLSDTAGAWSSGGDTEDNLHPSWSGYQKIGQAISDQLCGPLPSGSYIPLGGPLPFVAPPLLGDTGDTFNLLGTNMLFTADADSNGLADNVNMVGFQGTPTFSLVTDTAIKGKWQKLTASGTAGDYTFVSFGPGFNVTAGHRYQWSGRLKVNSASMGAGAQLYWYNTAQGNLVGGTGPGASKLTWLAPATGGGVFEHEFVMPSTDANGAALSNCGIALLLNGAAIDVQLAQLSVVDLTALGA